MANLKDLKTKQSSIQSINKITGAMQMVSIAKAQKAVKNMRSYKSYYEKVNDIILDIYYDMPKIDYDNTFWIVITSDLGLVGGYNTNIWKLLKENYKKKDKIIFVGSKSNYISKMFKESKLISHEDINHNRDLIFQKSLEAHFDKKMDVKIIYTKYVSQITFEPKVETLLPLQIENDKKTNISEIEFEPSQEVVLKKAMEIYLQTKFIYLYRESIASEHASRRMAMENATKNGEELLKNLKIEFNRLRQSQITQEISEIIGGAEALK